MLQYLGLLSHDHGLLLSILKGPSLQPVPLKQKLVTALEVDGLSVQVLSCSHFDSRLSWPLRMTEHQLVCAS